MWKRYFDKISVKSTHSIAFQLFSRNISFFLSYHSDHRVWKLRKFSLTLFSQKFRESNVFTKEFAKELIWRIFLQWEKISRFSTLWYVQIHSLQFLAISDNVTYFHENHTNF